MAVKPDGVLLRVIGDPIRMTLRVLAGVGAPLFETRRGADGGDLGQLVVAKLYNGLVGPECAARLQDDHHLADKGPLAVGEIHARGAGALGRQPSIPLGNCDILEYRRVGPVVDVGEDRVDDDGLLRCRGVLCHRVVGSCRSGDERPRGEERRHETARQSGSPPEQRRSRPMEWVAVGP